MNNRVTVAMLTYYSVCVHMLLSMYAVYCVLVLG